MANANEIHNKGRKQQKHGADTDRLNLVHTVTCILRHQVLTPVFEFFPTEDHLLNSNMAVK